METQKIDLFKPISATNVGNPPLVLRVQVTPSNASSVGGVMMASTRIEPYVLLSALPQELQERVKTAVNALIAGR